MTPGDIVLVKFPFGADRPPGEQFKKRPVLVLSSLAGAAQADEAIVVAMITGNEARFIRPRLGDVPIQEWQACGLDKRSVIRTRRIWTAESRDLEQGIRPLYPVSDTTLAAARAGVLKVLGL